MGQTDLGIRYRGGILIDLALCVGCARCYEICPPDVFEFDHQSGRPVVAHPEECWYCGACIYECPADGALRMELPLACL
jgi:NAD-dependent dihydropyrimidine dehydrogenase PreA subunit